MVCRSERAWSRLGPLFGCIFLGFLGTTIYAAGAQADVLCPMEIEVKQKVTKRYSGWTVDYERTAHQLSSVVFFDGPPSELVSLHPSEEPNQEGRDYSLWRFEPGRKLWMACYYAATTALLAKRLPSDVAECRVAYSPNVTLEGNPRVTAIACK